MSALTEKTLSMIDKEHIRPLPRWRTQWQNLTYWFGTGLLLGFSSLMAAISFHSFFEIDWDAYLKAHFTWKEIILSGVPLFSVGLLVVFLLASLWLLQRTRYGYRYSLSFLLFGFFFVSMSFGYLVEGSPLDEPTEQFFLYALPHTEEIEASLVPSAKRQWSEPERGLLGGTVLSSDENNLTLLDASQKLWTIDYSQASLEDTVSLEPYEKVKIIGSQEDETIFRATEIKAWEKEAQDIRKKEDEEEDDTVTSEKDTEKGDKDGQVGEGEDENKNEDEDKEEVKNEEEKVQENDEHEEKEDEDQKDDTQTDDQDEHDEDRD